MAKVIEFYVPDRFRESRFWNPAPEQRGKVIEFPARVNADVTSELNIEKTRVIEVQGKRLRGALSMVDTVTLQMSDIIA